MGRRKLDENRKRKKISTTINEDLWKLLGEYADENGKNKTKMLEKWISDGLTNKEVIEKLKKGNIILPDSKL